MPLIHFSLSSLPSSLPPSPPPFLPPPSLSFPLLPPPSLSFPLLPSPSLAFPRFPSLSLAFPRFPSLSLAFPRFPSLSLLPFPCSFPPFLVPSLPSPCFNIPSQYLPLSILLFFNFYKYLLFILEVDLFWGPLRYLSLCSSTRWRSRLRSRRAFCRLPSSPVPLPSP